MKKNEQYVGVDEKFIPEEEKFVDNNLNGEKSVGKKRLKLVKEIGIGGFVFSCVIIVLVTVIFGLSLSRIFTIDKQSEQQNKMDADDFNFGIESYSGTYYGVSVIAVLDEVVTKMKKNSDHSITVIYNSTTTSKVDEIRSLKKQFETNSEYEIFMDYDSNGFINKITISNY